MIGWRDIDIAADGFPPMIAREIRYIPYEAQDEYREAGWMIEPLTHTYMKEYALMASREVEGEDGA